MKTNRTQQTILALALTGAIAVAQDSTGGWRRVTDPPPNPQTMGTATAANTPPPPANPGGAGLDAYGQSRDAYGQMRGPGPGQMPPPQRQVEPATLPAELILRPGTFLTVRVDQLLSSDRNVAGDVFSATLVKPLVVDGFVVAQRGQTIAGRIVEVQKAGRISGTSRLAIELTDLSLVDGQQLRIHSQFVSYTGGTSKGRDAQAIGTTTAVGAAAGAIADNGTGAAIGAGAGAAVGIIGVLLTRGHASVIEPESVLTFRLEQQVVVSTARAPQAFHIVDSREYEREPAPRLQTRVVQPVPYPYYGGYYGGPYWGPSLYPYSYWGPSLGFYWGRSYWGGGRYYGGGHYYRGGGHYYRGHR